MDRVERFERELRSLRVTVTSPDGTVEITMSGAGEVAEVRLAPGCLGGHDEESLAEQIRLAVVGAVRGVRRTVVQADRAVFG